MGSLDCAGCTMIAFGPPLALFILVIARDPLRIILFVLGAFFWLMSLLISALLWFAVVPLREYLVFGLVFSVLFQEVFRFLFFLLLRKAQKGLDKISASGLEIAGVHSLKHARHTVAMVSGLGFGVMSGLFALVNVLADSRGPGIPGFPDSFEEYNRTKKVVHSDDLPNETFFLISSLTTTAVILLHVMWTVVFWNGCHTSTECSSLFKWDSVFVSILSVVGAHSLVSGLSFMNGMKLSYISLPITYLTLLLFSVYAYIAAGGNWRNIRNCVSCPKASNSSRSENETNNVENVVGTTEERAKDN